MAAKAVRVLRFVVYLSCIELSVILSPALGTQPSRQICVCSSKLLFSQALTIGAVLYLVDAARRVDETVFHTVAQIRKLASEGKHQVLLVLNKVLFAVVVSDYILTGQNPRPTL